MLSPSPLFTLICPLDTLTGIDMLCLAYNSELPFQLIGCLEKGIKPQQSEPNSPVLNSLNCGIRSLDHCDMVVVDEGVIAQLEACRTCVDACGALLKDLPKATPSWQLLAQKPELFAKTILLADVAANHHGDAHAASYSLSSFCDTLIQADKSLRWLGKQYTALEELATWLGSPLSEAMFLAATYQKDYLPGLKLLNTPLQGDHASLQSLFNREIALKGHEALLAELPDTTNLTLCAPALLALGIRVRQLQNCQLVLAPIRFQPVMRLWFYTQSCLIKGKFPDKLDTCLLLYYDPSSSSSALTNPKLDNQDAPDTSTKISNPLAQCAALELIAPANEDALVNDIAAPERWHSPLATHVHTNQYFSYLSVDFRANRTSPNPIVAQTNEFVDELLAGLLIGGRPLRHYGCTFYLPFEFSHPPTLRSDLRYHADELLNTDISALERQLYEYSEKGGKDEKVEDEKVEEKPLKVSLAQKKHAEQTANEIDTYNYLDPLLRPTLFATKDSNHQNLEVHEWRFENSAQNKNKHLSWHVQHVTSKESDQQYVESVWDIDIKSLRLFKAFNHSYILSIHVFKNFFEPSHSDNKTDEAIEAEKKAFLDEHNNIWWHGLFFGNDALFDAIQEAQVDRWLTFSQKVRELYIPFVTRAKDQEKGEYQFAVGLNNHPDDVKKTDNLTFETRLRILNHHANQDLAIDDSLLSHDITQLLSFFIEQHADPAQPEKANE
ncbi:MAG: hypothetical protein ACPGPF_05975, partial [Pontibacterium sp.]